MLLADTNLLARYFTQDDPVHSPRATRFIMAAAKRGEPIQVTDVVLAELFWVLISVMEFPREAVLRVVIALLGDPAFTFEDKERAAMAVGLWVEKKVDFTDAYLAARCRYGEAQGVASFDQDFKRLPVRWVQP
jgi:predicted nucleic-acid-binding protein